MTYTAPTLSGSEIWNDSEYEPFTSSGVFRTYVRTSVDFSSTTGRSATYTRSVHDPVAADTPRFCTVNDTFTVCPVSPDAGVVTFVTARSGRSPSMTDTTADPPPNPSAVAVNVTFFVPSTTW